MQFFFLLHNIPFLCYNKTVSFHDMAYMFPKKEYIDDATAMIKTMLPEKAGVFIFESSLVRSNFSDIDLAIVGDVPQETLADIREALEESTNPYIFDLVHFDHTSEQFQQSVLSTPILWIITPQK